MYLKQLRDFTNTNISLHIERVSLPQNSWYESSSSVHLCVSVLSNCWQLALHCNIKTKYMNLNQSHQCTDSQFQCDVTDICSNAIQHATVCQELFSWSQCKDWWGDLSAVTATLAATASDKWTDIFFSITQVSRYFRLNSSSLEQGCCSSTETYAVWMWPCRLQYHSWIVKWMFSRHSV